MTRRWSLITLIAVLAVALALVVTYLVVGGGESENKASGTESAAPGGGKTEAEEDNTPGLQGTGWWPLHQSGTGRAGEHDVVFNGATQWTNGPNGGALRLDGKKAYGNAGDKVIDTAGKDYSVAARVRLSGDLNGFRTAVSQDSKSVSAFFLQYSGADERFAFSFSGARALADKAGKPEADHWYHLTATYSQKDRQMRIYVDGELAGSRQATNQNKPEGPLVIGRGQSGGKPVDFWKGDIADVHVYDRALSADETKTLSEGEPE